MQKIVYWKMQNGHKHSFMTEEEDWTEDTNVPDAGWDETEINTQGDYYDFVRSSENTDGDTEEEYAYPGDISKAIDAGAAYYDNEGTLCFW